MKIVENIWFYVLFRGIKWEHWHEMGEVYEMNKVFSLCIESDLLRCVVVRHK